MKQIIDVLIVGAGPAGLTAALTLARGGRSVLVTDSAEPRNKKASHMQNFPSRDGTPPEDFRAQIRDDLRKYEAVEIISQAVHSIEKSKDNFLVTLSNTEQVTAKKILLAHGVKDSLPEIPGMNDIFGKSLFFCPYCHGYEHRNTPIAIIGNGDYVAHIATTVFGLTQDLKVFTNGENLIPAEFIEILNKKNIEIITDKITEIVQDNGMASAIKTLKGTIIPRNFIFTQANFKLSSDIGTRLGCKVTEMGFYQVDEFGRTSEPGVYAAGDIMSMRHSVLSACASGQMAAAMMNFEIMSASLKN